jgi:multicomponent Na+:H+ antiporter subunit D
MIPASLLIILIPLIAAAPAYVLRRWRTLEVLCAVITCGLAIAILTRPTETVLTISGFTISTQAPVNLLGRVLVVRPTDRMPLVLLFAAALTLFVLGWSVSQGWTFIPLGLANLSLLSTALLIRPFVFAALAFEAVAALGAIMVQAERSGEHDVNGALRYLVISTLALPAFLGAGYVVAQASAVSDPALQAAAYAPAVSLLGIGLALLFGAFPLFTWIHPVAKDAPPLTTAFLATVGTGAVTFLFLSFKQDFAWFRDGADIHTIANILGIAMLVFGGMLGWAQRSFSRVIACGLCVEIGSTLLLLNSNTALSVETIAFSIAARGLALGVAALGITLLREQVGTDDFAEIGGLGPRQMWAALAIAAGGLSLAGLPGTVGFVTRWVTVRVLGQTDLEILVLAILASASVGIGIIRGLSALFTQTGADVAVIAPGTPRRVILLIVVAVGLVIALGVAPGITSPITQAIAENYTFYK